MEVASGQRSVPSTFIRIWILSHDFAFQFDLIYVNIRAHDKQFLDHITNHAFAHWENRSTLAFEHRSNDGTQNMRFNISSYTIIFQIVRMWLLSFFALCTLICYWHKSIYKCAVTRSKFLLIADSQHKQNKNLIIRFLLIRLERYTHTHTFRVAIMIVVICHMNNLFLQ